MMGKRVDGGSKQCGGVREPRGSSAEDDAGRKKEIGGLLDDEEVSIISVIN